MNAKERSGYGRDIMQASIAAVNDNFNTTEIKLSAQTYLLRFYGDLGFKPIGETYLEDGIPHIAMIKTKIFRIIADVLVFKAIF